MVANCTSVKLAPDSLAAVTTIRAVLAASRETWSPQALIQPPGQHSQTWSAVQDNFGPAGTPAHPLWDVVELTRVLWAVQLRTCHQRFLATTKR
jgi:hypothetical protein